MSSDFITKQCNECEQTLSILEFGFSPRIGTHFPKCKECTKKRKKPWYQKDPNLVHSKWEKRKTWKN